MKVVYAMPMQDIPYKSAKGGHIKISNSKNAILKICILMA